MIIRKSNYGIITNAENTIIIEIEGLNQSISEVVLNLKTKILKVDDPIFTKMSVLTWWFLQISSQSAKDINEAQKKMGTLQNLLIKPEEEINSELHREAAEYCEKSKDNEIVRIDIKDSIEDTFKPLLNDTYDECQIVEIDSNKFTELFPQEVEPKFAKVRIMIFDPIRTQILDDGCLKLDQNELQKENVSQKEFRYRNELESYYKLLDLKKKSKGSINQLQLLNHGFIFLTENSKYRYVGHYMAYDVSDEMLKEKSNEAITQMNLLHQNSVSCIPSISLRECDVAISDKFCFVRAEPLEQSNSLLFEQEKQALTDFFGSK